MRGEGGYTLLEVLVAFVILIFALAALTGRLGIGLRTLAHAEAQAGAVAEASRILAELGHSRPLSYGVSEGDLGSGRHFRLEISQLRERPAGAAMPRLEGHVVKLRLFWQGGDRPAGIVFQTLRLGLER
jgi:general secretion pathway protein I